MVERLNHSGARGECRNELASGQVSDLGQCECAGPSVKRIGPVDQNLIVPRGKAGKGFGHVVPGNGEKHHFAGRCLFLGGSDCARPELMDNFSEAVGAVAIAELYCMARLQCLSGERLCKSSRSNGSDFHTRSFLSWAFQ